MDTKILEYILTIAEERSVSRAAERCYISQPMLSLHLKNVEEEYGTPLFVRTPGGMQLTPAGIIFANNARSILHAQAQLEKRLTALRRRQQKTLRLLLDSTFYNYYVREVQGAMRAAYPEYDIQVQTATARQACRQVKEAHADAAVFNSDDSAPPGLAAQVLFRDTLVPVVPLGCPPQVDSVKAAIDSGLMPLLHPVGTTMRTLEEKVLVRQGVLPASIMETKAFHLTMHYMQTRSCLGFLPQQMLEANPQYGLRPVQPGIALNCLLVSLPGCGQDAGFAAVLQGLGQAFTAFPTKNTAQLAPQPLNE